MAHFDRFSVALRAEGESASEKFYELSQGFTRIAFFGVIRQIMVATEARSRGMIVTISLQYWRRRFTIRQDIIIFP